MNKVKLNSVSISGQESGPHLLVTGGVHGDEFEPMAAIRRLISMFKGSQATPMLQRGQLTLVPIVNEPAFERGHRTAEDGKDLARTCPGNVDGSVTERIAHALSELIQTADYYIDLHTGGTELSVFPLAGYVLHKDESTLKTQRQMARAFNLPLVWGTSANLPGRSLSVARDANIPAIYAEYLGAATCVPHGVTAFVDGCLNVMSTLNMISRPQPPTQVKHVIEDRRPGSGHMQVCHPAPITGYFEPTVELGQSVEKGADIGLVCDTLESERHLIRSEEAGMVIVLRTFPRVMKGNSVAVVAPLR